MAKKTKTWKLGEDCRGGIITVELKKDKAIIINKEWDYAAGSNRGSNQSKAKELEHIEVDFNSSNPDRVASDFLHKLTTSYYAGQVMEWIEQNSDFKKKMFW